MGFGSSTATFAVRTFEYCGYVVTTTLTHDDFCRRPESGHYNHTSEKNSDAALNPGRVFFKTSNEAIAFAKTIGYQRGQVS